VSLSCGMWVHSNCIATDGSRSVYSRYYPRALPVFVGGTKARCLRRRRARPHRTRVPRTREVQGPGPPHTAWDDANPPHSIHFQAAGFNGTRPLTPAASGIPGAFVNPGVPGAAEERPLSRWVLPLGFRFQKPEKNLTMLTERPWHLSGLSLEPTWRRVSTGPKTFRPLVSGRGRPM